MQLEFWKPVSTVVLEILRLKLIATVIYVGLEDNPYFV